MANILMLNIPAEGHVNPSLGIAQAFADRGDSVYYISTEKFKDRLEGVGANVILHKDRLDGLDINHASSEGINNFSHFLMDTSLDILALTKELAQEISIDFVYYDAFGPGEIVKDYLQVPGFSSSASFLIPEEYKKNLPLHPDASVSFDLDEKGRALLATMKQEFGVAPKTMLQFMQNQGEQTMVYSSEYFQPHLSEFGEGYHFIGPSFPERKDATDFPIDQLENEQVLFISMGTVLDHVESFFNMCIDAFTDFPGKVVISAGSSADFTKLKEAPDHFIIRKYVPQLDVLQHTNVFLTHGGMNSTNEAIYFEVPMVVLPHDKDQPLVAARLAELQAGYPIFPPNVTIESLQHAVNQVVHNVNYQLGIRKIKESFQACGGPNEALEIIDRHLASR
ncbi:MULTISPECIES: macrolide family glycosyltransferase [Bacillaceae]|uniref:macrolide family glycosyltransferase n=1 Tax=Bacillales TaxID=1385 RepID=UPI0018834D8B|nr:MULTISPECIES: macrolide family glycosyltransferase [Bacillaceae]MBF0707670.1 UDP-glucosyltransferase [Pseudalkalibacillus hwajinpoensis]MDO6654558.1 glycosyltransferase [Anaerobacillus sp. 1_MG-2023]